MPIPATTGDFSEDDPRDLLKLYLYGYLNQIRSSRRLEAECRRNVELMWLLGRLYPDHKSIAEFRRHAPRCSYGCGGRASQPFSAEIQHRLELPELLAPQRGLIATGESKNNRNNTTV